MAKKSMIKKKLFSMCFLTAMSAAMSLTAFAEQSQQDQGGEPQFSDSWQWIDDDGDGNYKVVK